jgi:hypothetical protein
MYQFQLTNGHIAKIYFSHKGGKKGSLAKPGKPPRFTVCTIVSETGTVLGEGTAAPIGEIVETLPVDFPAKYAQTVYRQRLKRLIKTDDGNVHAILKGDSFSRSRGREESLKKALEPIDKADRLGAWEALHEEPILLTDVLSDLPAGKCTSCTCK